MIDFVTPVAPDRDLGKAYNKAIMSSDAEWICIRDCDTLFLNPMNEVLATMLEAIDAMPSCKVFSCLTNRIYWPHQLYKGQFSEDPNVANHRIIAGQLMKQDLTIEMTKKPISGFMMLINCEFAYQHPFAEGVHELLHVDKSWSKKILDEGFEIGIIHNIYLFHYYRLLEGRASKKHLQ